MRFKPGVVTFGWGPKIERALELADQASWMVLGREGCVTSGRDGNHSENSLHYWRRGGPTEAKHRRSHGAFDLRTWAWHNVPSQIGTAKREAYAEEIRRLLEIEFPGEFDVVVEANHIHVEMDVPEPRRMV